jgi:hypothetical protein
MEEGRGASAPTFRTPRLDLDRGEDAIARLLAAPTRLGAHPAVLHPVLGVLLAFLCAQPARLHAGLHNGAQHLCLRTRLPGEDPAGSLTHVGAIEVEADAAGQHLHIPFAYTGVSAGGAGLGAVEAGLYALHQGGLVHRGLAGVGLDHLLGVGPRYSPFSSLVCLLGGVPRLC